MAGRHSGRALLGVIVSVAIFVSVGELLARALHVVDRMNGFPRALYLATDLPDLPYQLRPGVHVTIRNFSVRVNTLGLRGAETTQRPTAGRRRLLVLGDSVVYGDGLDEADTFPVLVEHDLAAGGMAAEVLNAAAPGYNTAAELTWLREFGLALSPDTVILGVSLNDYGPAPVMTPAGILASEPGTRSRLPWLTNHSELYTLLGWLTTYARGDFWWQKVGKRREGPQQKSPDEALPVIDEAIAKMHKNFYAAPHGPGWDSVRESLAALRDLARARGLALTVVVFPEKYQVGPDANLDAQRVWLALCAELDLRCLDLQPAFAAAASSGPLFQDTQHPNAAGMRVAAQATAEFLAPEVRR